MPISEQDISILIPTYRYRDKLARAVESALASGAGEIIVTDDHSQDGTLELLAGYRDPRLRVYENTVNLGLWENHLGALQRATKPWIKFIQADDYLLPGGLAAYAAAADPDVTVVWCCPIVKDDDTGAVMQFHNLVAPRIVEGKKLLEVCVQVGWLLGSPSHMLVRSDAITRDPKAWDTEISADVLLGSIAAADGKVVLLPPGAIGQGAHPRQDAKTQGVRRGLRRMVGTPVYLYQRPEPTLQRFATLWAAMNWRPLLRTALSGVLRGRITAIEAVRLLQWNWTLSRVAEADRCFLQAARTCRRSTNTPLDVDAVLDRLYLTNCETL